MAYYGALWSTVLNVKIPARKGLNIIFCIHQQGEEASSNATPKYATAAWPDTPLAQTKDYLLHRTVVREPQMTVSIVLFSLCLLNQPS